MDPNVFNVFVTDFNPDSTKTHALPFNASTLNNHIRAINYQYPIKISWDSSLFSSYFSIGDSQVANAYIQNDYFFLVNNGGPIPGSFNMIETNSVAAPTFNWGSMNQFPMQICITRFSTSDIDAIAETDLFVSPNPFFGELSFNTCNLKYVRIISVDGKIVFEHSFEGSINTIETIDMNHLSNGLYILIYKNNPLVSDKSIKNMVKQRLFPFQD